MKTGEQNSIIYIPMITIFMAQAYTTYITLTNPNEGVQNVKINVHLSIL